MLIIWLYRISTLVWGFSFTMLVVTGGFALFGGYWSWFFIAFVVWLILTLVKAWTGQVIGQIAALVALEKQGKITRDEAGRIISNPFPHNTREDVLTSGCV
jgi:hypothetical protein